MTTSKKMKGGKMRKISILAIAIIFLFCINGVLAAHIVTNTTTLNIPVGNTYRINISVNNTDVNNANITEVNVTLPSSFSFLANSQGTDAIGAFTNTSVRLSWLNTTTFLVRNNTKNYFWFNITPSLIGAYVIGVNTTNSSSTMNTALTVNVTDTVNPAVTLSPTNNTLIRSSSVTDFTCTLTDNYNLSTVTFYLWYPNSTSYNTTIYDKAGTSNSLSITSFNLPSEGSSTWTCRVNDSSNNAVWGDNYTITYTPYGSTSDAPGSGGGYVPITQTQDNQAPIFSTVDTQTGSLGFLTKTYFGIPFWMIIVGIVVIILLASGKKGRR